MSKILERFQPSVPSTAGVSRRSFIIGASAAGLAVGVIGCSPSDDAVKMQGPPNPEVNAWVHIDRNDMVTVRIARSEMGQGTATGLAQIVAEELDCDWENVRFEFPTPGQSLKRDGVYQSFSTGGSQGVRGSVAYMREGGAAARAMLIEAAANRWGVAPGDCTAKLGVITGPDGQSLRYGEVAGDASQLPPPLEVTLKDQKDWTIIGQPKARLDTAEKVTGALKYGQDLSFPNMLCASIKQCPHLGGKLVDYDETAIAHMPGIVKIVKLDNAVAVIGQTWWQAHQALEALPIAWDAGELASYSSKDIHALVEDGLASDKTAPVNGGGDLAAAFTSADKVIEATYGFPAQNHATMEPMNATALWTEEGCEVWAPTQNAQAALSAAAEASGHDVSKCDVHKTILGGGFGRRGMSDYVTQAVLLAKEMPGRHVKLMWSREEDMLHGFYHPVTKAKLRGALDKDGKLSAIDMHISGQSILATLAPQAVENFGGFDPFMFQGLLKSGMDDRVEDQTLKHSFPAFRFHGAMRNPPIRPGFWRGVNANQNAVYLNCFLDEMAQAAGRDSLEFMLEQLQDSPEMTKVLSAVAAESGWGKEDGRSRGLSCFYSFGSYTAACAEVTVSDDGKLKMHRIVAATDPGTVANPQQVEAQVQGSFVYGLTAMLYGDITYENGQQVETNFDRYDSLRLADMPDVDVLILPSGGFWGGVGEPTISVATPAVLNAIAAATGKRVRQLPIKDQNLRA